MRKFDVGLPLSHGYGLRGTVPAPVSVCRVGVMVVVAESCPPSALAMESNSSSRETRRPRQLFTRTAFTQSPFRTNREKPPECCAWGQPR